jgi:selenocysteine-specific elongation factor
MLLEAGGDGIEASVLPIRLGLPPAECQALVRRAATLAVSVGIRVVSRAALESLAERAVSEVGEFHAQCSLDPGMPTQLLRTRLSGTPEVIDGALEAASRDGKIVIRGGVLALAGWAPKPTPQQATLMETLVSRLEEAGAEPPSVEELSAGFADDPEVLLRYLERQGDVVQVEQGRYYSTNQLKAVLARIRHSMTGGIELNPSQLREVLGLSRKYLIPLLEYCDRLGYTNRTGTGRVWREGAKPL